jgi:RHS repeat-associated protein
MTDGMGTTTFTYNPIAVSPALGAGVLASVDGPLANDVVNYSYDELGRVASRGLTGFATSFSHDALGRRTTEVSPLGNFAFTYDGVTGRPLSVSYPNGQSTQYTYFPNSGDHRLQQIKHTGPGGVGISKYDYTYSPVGSIATWSQQVGPDTAKVYTLGYDNADELTTANVSGPTPLPVPSRFAYAYDAAGNRTGEQRDDTPMAASYNNRNQLMSLQPGGAVLLRGTVSETATVTVQGKPAQVTAANTLVGQALVPSGTSNVVVAATDPSGNTRTNTYQVTEAGSTATYTYDANGNLTSDGTRAIEWDARNRIVAITQGQFRSEFSYDGKGHRVRIIEKDGGSVTADHRYVWCDDRICEERDSTGATVTKRYFERAFQQGGVNYFSTADHLGSVRDIADSLGAVVARYDYDPHGRRVRTFGSINHDFGFTGFFFHAASGLDLTWFRAYDAEVGRWLSEDPMGEIAGPNRYGYVDGNPANYIDQYGLSRSKWPNPPPPPLSCSEPPPIPQPPPLDCVGGACVDVPDVIEVEDLLKPCYRVIVSRSKCKTLRQRIDCEEAVASGLPSCKDVIRYLILPIRYRGESCEGLACDA